MNSGKMLKAFTPSANNRVLFVSSEGGHFVELLDFIKQFNFNNFNVIVSGKLNFDIEELNIIRAPQADRDFGVFKQFIFAFAYLIKFKPKVIISSGAGIAVPFFMLSRFYNCKTIYIETPTAITKPTLTAYIVQFFSDRLYVRSRHLKSKLRNAIYLE